MEEILKLMIESLVDNKDLISIKQTNDGDHVKFEVSVAQDEMGKIIGKRGKTAQAIRTIMKPVASKERKTVDIEFIDAE